MLPQWIKCDKIKLQKFYHSIKVWNENGKRVTNQVMFGNLPLILCESDNNLSCTTLLGSTSSTLPSELTKECHWTVKLRRREGTKNRDYPETENVGKFLDCVILRDCVIVIRQTSRVSRLSPTRLYIIRGTWSMPNRLSVSILQPSTTTNWMSSAYRRSVDVVKINKFRILSDNCEYEIFIDPPWMISCGNIAGALSWIIINL